MISQAYNPFVIIGRKVQENAGDFVWKAELAAKLKKCGDCDPEVLVQLEGQTKMAKEAVNRWTDNIFSAHSWIGKRFPHVEVSQLNKQYEIPEELDYIE